MAALEIGARFLGSIDHLSSSIYPPAVPWQRQQFPRRQRLGRVISKMDVPDFLPATWGESRLKKPLGPTLALTAEDTILQQLDALQENDRPYPDHGIEVMYRFAAFDPFSRSNYFGRYLDLGQFERFRRIYHHQTYRVLLGHKERRTLSSLRVSEHSLKERIWIQGARPDEEGTFEFTLVQMVGGSWDGYWLTESLIHDGEGLGTIPY
ncbi:uncharacterized protein LOC112346274 [Selaginella moellendorffii]|nr:uncharacterized protein LOC112346274 [Selaginella moellendorffii]|eukprot:XP_024530642.1 uncharacterized protein LOC112346274 [Selaginella moellendorffii]